MDGIKKQIEEAQTTNTYTDLTVEKLEKLIKDIEGNHTKQDLKEISISRYCLSKGFVISSSFDLKLCSNPDCDSCRAIDKSMEEMFKIIIGE